MFLRVLTILALIALPFYTIRFSIGPLPTTLLEVIILSAVGIWVIEKIRTRTFPRLPYAWWWPMGIFGAASILALAAAPAYIPALGHWRAFIVEPMLFALMLRDIIMRDARVRSWILSALAVSLLIPVAYALYQQMTGNGIPNEFWAAAATRRVTSIYGYPNALGLYAVPILILLLPRIIESYKNKIRAGGLSLLLLAACIAIYCTRSKGALLALAGGVSLYVVLNAKKKLLVITTIAVVSLLGLFALKDAINLRGISTVQGGDSITVRTAQYRETWAMLKDHPFTGAGLRGYQSAMGPYHQRKHIEIFMYPHNIFLAVWSELGLLGLVAFIWIIAQFFITSIRAAQHTDAPDDKRAIYASCAAMSALLIHGLVDVPYFKNDLAIFFWVLIALSIAKYSHENKFETYGI